ncbi:MULTISPECIES: hypothetical protein [unclassified Bradyrhizobium]|uniref:hypothetical protein n=1 Tax=unclassified Bradyrhizobium TaxID=2631580 RepID=UPI001FFA8D6F|nr:MULTISPECIES: hypothetical protein [unclassified Bradyrhizobium]MCK1345782.1 hypothetical protein [Bradyrhizobium sp. CW11]MCK1587118.1 hypothetical protein [Bradyrhizobium sp. 169]
MALMFHLNTLVAVALMSSIAAASGQSTPPHTGLTIQGPADQSQFGAVAKDALGRPCVDVEAAARPETVNPDMLDHIVSLKNSCSKPIKAKVCYYGSDRCRDIVLEPYKRVDTLLGSMRGIKFFRYSLTTR